MTNGYQRVRYNLARALAESHVLLSPYFFRASRGFSRPGPLTEYLIERAAYCMNCIQSNAGLAFDAIAGDPQTGDPFAADLAHFSRKTQIRLEERESGGKRCVASFKGKVPGEAKRVLLVDGFFVEATFEREMIQFLESQGMEVPYAMAVIDCEKGGREELAEWGCTLHSIFTVSELADITRDMDPQFHNDLQGYLANCTPA